MDALTSFMDQLLRNFRIADAVDILLIALIIYCALIWFGETTSRRMLAGVTVLALIYLAARVFDMHLTSLVFHTGFTVLLILLIVVFQEDLRRIISRIAGWMSLQNSGNVAGSGELEVLVDSLFSLAKRRIGALVVLPGEEVLERHLSGGHELHGRISGPLLDSIFDPSSDGHDGAIVIEGDRVMRFGAHLPISINLPAIRGHGTRHSAALGLTERSDALVIVVSEERGVVSLARSGKLRHVESEAALLKLLEESPAIRHDASAVAHWSRHFLTHWRMKVLALSMALIAWFVLAYDPTTVARTFDAPIEYRNLPSGLVLEKPVANAKLTLSGSDASFRFITPDALKITIDLSKQTAGSHTIQLGKDNVQLPSNVEIDSIEPDVLWLYLREPTPPPEGT